VGFKAGIKGTNLVKHPLSSKHVGDGPIVNFLQQQLLGIELLL